jgi:hypothetical protein
MVLQALAGVMNSAQAPVTNTALSPSQQQQQQLQQLLQQQVTNGTASAQDLADQLSVQQGSVRTLLNWLLLRLFRYFPTLLYKHVTVFY